SRATRARLGPRTDLGHESSNHLVCRFLSRWPMMSIYPLGHQASRRKTMTMESEARVQTIRVGCLGLGNMGSGIAENIVRAGFEVAAFDIRPEARNRLSQLGAKAAQSPAEAARDAALLTVTVLNDEQVRH